MLYEVTKDIMLVKQWAGHKSLSSTLVYMQVDLRDKANDIVAKMLQG
jgi:hypothetical protein